MKGNTFLIIASSEADADLYYETSFFAPDPFIFIEHSGKKILLLSELEVDRAKREARVDEVLSTTQYKEKLPPRKRSKMGFKDIIDLVFKERGIKGALVPGSFPIKHADELRRLGYKVQYKKEEPFFDKRKIKTEGEIGYVRESLRKAEKAMDLAIGMIASSGIKGKRLIYKGRTLTSEMVKEGINSELSKMGCAVSHTIVACGIHSSMPHHEGEGAATLRGRTAAIHLQPLRPARGLG